MLCGAHLEGAKMKATIERGRWRPEPRIPVQSTMERCDGSARRLSKRRLKRHLR